MFWPGSRVNNTEVQADHPHKALVRDDAALVAAARASPHAFASLYQRYLRQVYRYCYIRLGTREAPRMRRVTSSSGR